MVQAALDMNYAASLRKAQTQARNPSQGRRRNGGQVIDARSRFAARSGQASTGGAVARDNVIPLNNASVPQARNPIDEMAFKRDMAKKRHMDKMRAQQFALPAEFADFTNRFDDDQAGQMKDWYGEELEQGGMGEMVAARLKEKIEAPIRQAIDKRIEELKKKAIEKVKAKAKEAFKKAFKDATKKGTKKVVWSAIDQGSIIEIEGAALESWFGSGTLLTSYQGFIGAVNGGKTFMPEGTIIDWLEPSPIQVPSNGKPKNAAEAVTATIQLYDLFMWLLMPIYWFLCAAVFALLHLAVIYTATIILLPLAGLTALGIAIF